MLVDPVSIKALQNMLGEMEKLLATPAPPSDDRTARCLELVQTAKALMNDMVKRASRVQ